MTMRTRFAPSPTGFLHVGGARTALFCHLQARHVGGKWLLRVEDTDRERSTPEAVRAILDGLHWLGLDPDEGPFFQSDHTANYLAAAHRLLDEGKAYRCTCTKEELDAMREEQRQKNEKPRYDGRCRQRTDHPPERPAVIRFITPMEGEVAWDDGIQGTIRFQNNELDDLVLVRSDGSPTYNLAVVVDDHDMGITDVIRGEDHISNTPRQIHLFRALGWPVPNYAHMPLLHGEDGAKLSKRHGAVSVLQYREEGFLPEALNNYLVRMGWSHGEQEVFSMEEMIQFFDVKDVGRSAAIFNTSKLHWLNDLHMRRTPVSRLAEELAFHLESHGMPPRAPAYLEAVIPTLLGRAKTLKEMVSIGRFYFVETVEPYQEAAVKKHFKPEVVAPFDQLLARLEALDTWENEPLEACFKEVVADAGVGMGKLAQPVRVALTGGDVSPSLYDVLRILGRELSLARLRRGAEILHHHMNILSKEG